MVEEDISIIQLFTLIIVIDGKKITINLNGHTVDRNRTESDSDGHVFEVKGKADVTITSTGSTRAIVKGGYAKNGGAVNIQKGSTAALSNIEFVGNKASTDGGAIYSRGHFIMDAYDDLTDDEKKLIENYDVLVSAEAEYFAKLFLADVESALAVPGAASDVAATLSPIWNEKDTPDGKSF